MELSKAQSSAAAPPIHPPAQPRCREETVKTDYGSVVVAVQGDPAKPAFVTFHDLGLNNVTNFQPFFGFSGMRFLFKEYCVYHINAPGQQENADVLPDTYGFKYPTMDQLAEQVATVLKHFGLKHIIGFGVGAGAYILGHFVLIHPEMVKGLIVLNGVFTPASGHRMDKERIIAKSLRENVTSYLLPDYLIWHHFGEVTKDNESLAEVYRRYIQYVNPRNLGLFVESFTKRSQLPLKESARQMPVLVVVGEESPYLEDALTLHRNLIPGQAELLKLQNCGMVMEEQPQKLAEALQRFLQEQRRLFPENPPAPEGNIPQGLEGISLEGEEQEGASKSCFYG